VDDRKIRKAAAAQGSRVREKEEEERQSEE